jgi:hypothetical protein
MDHTNKELYIMKNQEANIIKIMTISLILFFFGLMSIAVMHAENYTSVTKLSGYLL